MEKGKIIFLLHMDHCDGDHSYALYKIPEGKLEDASRMAYESQEKYEGQDEEDDKSIEDFLEEAFTEAGIEFESLEYGVTYMSM